MEAYIHLLFMILLAISRYSWFPSFKHEDSWFLSILQLWLIMIRDSASTPDGRWALISSRNGSCEIYSILF